MATKKKATATEEESVFIVGDKIRVVRLSTLKPNTWNPNLMAAHKYESLKEGLKNRGWLASDTLLVWCTNEKGEPQNVIIDGEHRWKGALELGFTRGPALFLEGLTREEAQAWTLRLGNRGEFDRPSLDSIVRELMEGQDDVEACATSLAMSVEEVMRALTHEAVPLLSNFTAHTPETFQAGSGPAWVEKVISKNSLVKPVPLYMSDAQHAMFERNVSSLAARYNVTSPFEVVREAAKRHAE